MTWNPYTFAGGQSTATTLQAPLPPGKSVRLLLVEDLEDNRDLVTTYLRDTEYQVEIAENGAVACEKIRERNYDLVLMDIQMPVMDGLTATKQIRNWEQNGGKTPMPIIALTARVLAEDEAKSQEAGCTAHLAKPISRQSLLLALKRYQVSTSEPESWLGVVDVPPGLKALVPGYLAGRRNDIAILRSALAQADYAVISRLGHNLKGTGTPYGFPDITAIGRLLECAGKESDHAEASRHIERFASFLEFVAEK